jgi:hypothetical protein
MTSQGHQLCIGSASKCFEGGIVEEKRKKMLYFSERSGAACTVFTVALLSIYVYSNVGVMVFEKARS